MGGVKLTLKQTSNLKSVALSFDVTGSAVLHLCGETYFAPRVLQQHTKAIFTKTCLFSESKIDSLEHLP